MNSEKFCLCLPLKCGMISASVLILFFSVLSIILGIFEMVSVNTAAGAIVTLCALPFVWVVAQIIKFFLKDTKRTRQGLFNAGVVFTISFFIYNTVACIVDSYFNVRLPTGPGSYPDSEIEAIEL